VASNDINTEQTSTSPKPSSVPQIVLVVFFCIFILGIIVAVIYMGVQKQQREAESRP